SSVNKIKISHGWYVTTRNGQHGVLQHPHVGRGSEFPNLVGHCCIDPKSAEDVELVVKDRKATGQSYPVTVSRPGRSNGVNHVGDRVITKQATSSRGLSSCRAAYAVDVVCSRVV